MVLGGDPPPSGAEDAAGFAEWAETVVDGPMPVRYCTTLDFIPIYNAGQHN